MGFKETVKRSCASVKRSVTGFADNVKSEYKKGQLKNELSELYETLGQVRYEELLAGGEVTEESARLCEEIARLKSEIESLEREETKENACKVCGKRLPNDITYCPYCGSKTEDKE